MKVFIVISIIAAALTAVSQASDVTDNPKHAGRTKIADKLAEIEKAVIDAAKSIMDMAKKDNPSVAAEIEKSCKHEKNSAQSTLQDARDSIARLTKSQIHKYFSSFKLYYINVKDNLQSLISKLSDPVEKSINEALDTVYRKTEKLVNEIIDIVEKQ